jgi:hypothetical protein
MNTYPKVPLHPHRLVLSLCVGGVGIVVKGVGWLPLPSVVNQAREVGPTQKTQDAIDMACETTTQHNGPVPTLVIKKKY